MSTPLHRPSDTLSGYHATGTGLLALAASCAAGEVLALVWLFTGHGSPTDRSIVATSLAGAVAAALAGRHNRITARRIIDQARATEAPPADRHELP